MRFGGLWRHPDFLRFWLGQTVSAVGTVVTRDALLLAAVLTLKVTPLEIGFLSAASAAPVVLLGLLAGVWADRLRRRPIMIAADVGRALVLLTVPAAAMFGVLTIELLYAVAAVTGALTIFFDVAYQAYLPSLVTREHLAEGNSKLGVSSSLGEIGGPALAGALVQAVSAPFALFFDALSYLVSALAIWRIHTPESLPKPPVAEQSVSAELLEGLRLTFGHPVLRALVLAAVTSNLFGGIIGALYYLYAVEELGFTPALLGGVIALGGIGALAGALLAEPLARRFRPGPMLRATYLAGTLLTFTIPLAPASPFGGALFLGVGQVFGDLLLTVYLVQEVTVRQTVTPDALLGRASAAYHFVTALARPAGALLGGALGQSIGLRPALTVAAIGLTAGVLWLTASRVRRL